MIVEGSRVRVNPRDSEAVPSDHTRQGTIREIADSEVLSPPQSMYWVELDGLPQYMWQWFFGEELEEIEQGQPSSRIGDTIRSPYSATEVQLS